MKKYDLGKNAKQFGKKQFWTVDHKNYQLWISYQTAVAFVDKDKKKVYLGCKAYGYSRTTSKQVTQAIWEFARGFEVVEYGSEEYTEFQYEEYVTKLIDKYGHVWDDYNAARAAIGMLESL